MITDLITLFLSVLLIAGVVYAAWLILCEIFDI